MSSATPFWGPQHFSLVQQMLDKFFLDTGLFVQAMDVRPELAAFSDRPIPRDPGTVILHSQPNPRLPSKDWGIERWKALSEILHERGLSVSDGQVRIEFPLLPNSEAGGIPNLIFN